MTTGNVTGFTRRQGTIPGVGFAIPVTAPDAPVGPQPMEGAHPNLFASWEGPRGHRPTLHYAPITASVTHTYNGNGAGLATWIQNLPNGAVARISPGIYTIPDVIHLTNKQWITLLVEGVTIRVQRRDARIFMLWRCNFMFLDGGSGWFQIEGMHGTPHYQYDPTDPTNSFHINHAFDIQGCWGFIVRNCRIRQIWGDFVRIGRYGTQARNGWSRHVIFDGLDADECGRQGFSLVAGEYTVLRNYKIRNVARSVLNIEPGGANDGSEYLGLLNGEIGLSQVNSYFPANPWSNPTDVCGKHVYVDGLHCTAAMIRGEHNKKDHDRWLEDWELRNISWAPTGQRSNSHFGMFNSRRFRRLILGGTWNGSFTNVSGQPNSMAIMRVGGLDGLTIENNLNIQNKRCDVIAHNPGVSPMNALPAAPAATRFYTGPGQWNIGML